MVDYALKGCPACQSMLHNGNQKFTCRWNYTQCNDNKRCLFKNRVVDVLMYLDNSNDITEIKDAMQDVLKYLREKR